MSSFNPIFYYNSITSSFKTSLIAAYKLSNGNDELGLYNGTPGASVTFSSTNAVDGNAGQFINNSNSRIIIPNNSVFSFNNGTVDSPFCIKANINSTNSSSTQPIFSKYNGSLNNTSEYMFYTRVGAGAGRLAIILFNKTAGGAYLGVETINSVTNGVTNNVIVNYNGNGSTSGIQLIVNGVVQSTNNFSVGSYTSMGTTSLTPIIGSRVGASNQFVGTIDELYVFNKFLNSSEIAALQSNYYPNF